MPDPLPRSPSVVVGVDGSASARAALRYAAEIAPQLGLPLHALLVWDYPNLEWGDSWSTYPDPDDRLPRSAEEIVAAEAAAVFPDGIPPWVTTGTRRGRAAQALIDVSREAALLVVGTRGRGGFAELLLGSVSHACASHAHCPVVIVHDDGSATTGGSRKGGPAPRG